MSGKSPLGGPQDLRTDRIAFLAACDLESRREALGTVASRRYR